MKMKKLLAIALIAMTCLTAVSKKASALTLTTVTNSFSAVATGGANTLFIPAGAAFTASSTGTFSASLVLMRSLDGFNWTADPGGAAWTGAITSTFTVTVNTPANSGAYYRIDCTAYTSGTPYTTLAQTDNYLRSARNTYGNSIRDEYDSGQTLVIRPQTLAQIQARVPSQVGEVLTCSNCTVPYSLVFATGTAAGSYDILITSNAALGSGNRAPY